MKPVSANGVKGTLLRSIDGYLFFRVYRSANDFTDHEIRQHDLDIIITDPDAFFYKTSLGDDIIDHSPATLGYPE